MSEEEKEEKEKPDIITKEINGQTVWVVEPETIDAITTSTATATTITARLEENVSVKDELKGPELLKVRSDIKELRQTLEEVKDTTSKLTPLLPLSDLDAKELKDKAPYIIVYDKLEHVKTIAENAKKYSKEAKKEAKDAVNTASNIRNIHIFILVLYAIVSLILILVGIQTFLTS